MRSERSVTSSVYHSEKIQLAKYQSILVDRFKQKIMSNGIRGLIELRKKFRELDQDTLG
jgi:Ca2+-binding EF-hand superfamily protein